MDEKREAEIRRYLTEGPGRHPWKPETAPGMLRDAMAALGALPVLRTCGDCGWCGWAENDERRCRHPRVVLRLPRNANGESDPFPTVDGAAAPPDWCPLRS